MMRKYIILGCAALMVFVVACKKDKNMEKATVVDTGDIAKNGCGYMLQLESDGSVVRPKYMPSSYQHNGMKVKVKINRDGEGEICNTYPTKKFYEIVQIVDIKKDLD
ncbi:hypothetical protein CAP35_03220 [Chitinophagaceae bacterium IBVUCB1]|nr:hypothetical protein CAP35_03220 [Chitinophagaceae bacterium IBVUCB1]